MGGSYQIEKTIDAAIKSKYIDNVFVVTGIDHSLSQGKFETKLKMTQTDAFGKYISMFGSVKSALTAMSDG